MGWKEDLPESVQNWDEVKNSETAEKFFEQIASHRSALGQSIRIPGEDADAEVVTAFQQKLIDKVPGLVKTPSDGATEDELASWYKSIGRPEENTAYTMPELEGEVSAEAITALREQAHQANLTPAQFKRLAKQVFEGQLTAAEEAKVTHAAGLGELQKKWGEAYKEKRDLAEQVRSQYLAHIPEGDSIGAATIEALAALGKQLGGKESSNINSTTGQQKGGAITPDEAQLKIGEMLQNKDHAYWNRKDAGHMAARRKMSELNRMAYSGS